MTLVLRLKLRWKKLFLFNDTSSPEIYALSLRDARPIFPRVRVARWGNLSVFVGVQISYWPDSFIKFSKDKASGTVQAHDSFP